ncbi:MAG: type VI secretion system contractile sheath large subunit [Polyangiales bacterium]
MEPSERAVRPSRLRYPSIRGDAVVEAELPFTILVLGEFVPTNESLPPKARPASSLPYLLERFPVEVTQANFDELMKSLPLELTLDVRNASEAGCPTKLRVESLSQFSPGGVVAQSPELRRLLELRGYILAAAERLVSIPALARRISAMLCDEGRCDALRVDLGLEGAPSGVERDTAPFAELCALAGVDEAWEVCYPVQRGLQHVLAELLYPRSTGGEPLEVARTLAADIEHRVAAQVREILHHPEVLRLEARWRALRALVDRVAPFENVRVELLHCDKDELFEDFDDTPDITKSSLHALVSPGHRGLLRAQPLGLLVADYTFDQSPRDLLLLERIAGVAAMARAVVLTAPSPAMFMIDDWQRLPGLPDLASLFGSALSARWRAFRERDDARYVALCMPRFLARAPYVPDDAVGLPFAFDEAVERDADLCWASAAYLFAATIARSLARTGLPTPFTGRGDGTLAGLPLPSFVRDGRLYTRHPLEVRISDRREAELAREGFVSLVSGDVRGSVAVLSAVSCHARPNDARGVDPTSSLGAVLLESRVAHYIELMRYERRWEGSRRVDFERDLATWLTRLVATPDGEADDERGVRCCRDASIVPTEADANPRQWPSQPGGGWWVKMLWTPSGAWPITVSLTPRETAADASYSVRFRVGVP